MRGDLSLALPASASGAPGYSVFYGYDMQNLQLFARLGSSSGAGITNSYDGFGRLVSSTNTLSGVNRTLTSDYDAGSRRNRLTFPDGQYFTYEHDPAGRLTAIRENGAAVVASFTQDILGRRAGATRGGALTGYDYDELSRLTDLNHDLAGTAADQSLGFTFSPASQMISRSSSNAAYAPSPAPTLIRNYSINGLNQYTSIGGTAHSYDDNGNLTSGKLTPTEGITSFVYDTENRLISASGAKNATLAYDPLGRLLQASGGGNVTQFLYDGDKLVAEYDGQGNLKRRYVHGAGIDEPLLWYEGTGLATRRGLLADHQGSIIAVTTPTGSAYAINGYDAWGIPNQDNDGRFQYTGQAWLPELGLYHYKARIYAPTLGRFLQTDPIGYDDQMNLYAYVGNDPLNKTDPTGQWVWHAVGAAINVGVYLTTTDNPTFGGTAVAAAAGAFGGSVVKAGAQFGKTAFSLMRTSTPEAAGAIGLVGGAHAGGAAVAGATQLATNIVDAAGHGELDQLTHPLEGVPEAAIGGWAAAPLEAFGGDKATGTSAGAGRVGGSIGRIAESIETAAASAASAGIQEGTRSIQSDCASIDSCAR